MNPPQLKPARRPDLRPPRPIAQITGLLDEARRFADAGEYPRAIALCREAGMQGRDESEVHFLLGVLYSVTGDRRGAEDALKRTLQLDPGHAEALVHLGSLLRAERREAELLPYLARQGEGAGRS